MKETNLSESAAQGAKNAKRRKADAARRLAKAKELQDAAEKRYRGALALVRQEAGKPRLTKSVREALERGEEL